MTALVVRIRITDGIGRRVVRVVLRVELCSLVSLAFSGCGDGVVVLLIAGLRRFVYQTWNWVIGSPGQWVIWVSSFTSGLPSHRVIILTRLETRVFPVFEKMPKM